MEGRKFKLLLLLVVLVGYIEPSVEEPPSQLPKNTTATTENENDNLRPVNLIFPRVEYIDKVQCDPNDTAQLLLSNCTIKFWTKLAKYQITYTNSKIRSILLRSQVMYTRKALRTDVVYLDGKGHTFQSRVRLAQEWLTGGEGGGLVPKNKPEEMPEYMVCDAYASFIAEGNEYDLCIHDLTIVIRFRKTKLLYVWAPVFDLVDQSEYSGPITSAYVYTTSGSTMDKGLYLLWTTAVGRMRFGKLIIKKDKIIVEPEDTFDLSIIPIPTVKNSPVDKLPNYLSKKPELEKKFKKDLEMKWRSNFIMAASPIYQSFSIKNRNAENITEEKLDSIGLCFVRGYNMSETQEAPLSTNFECKLNGVNQNSFVELPKLHSALFGLVIHAYHVVNVDGYRYIHLFFTSGQRHHQPTSNLNRYMFCKLKGEYSPGRNFSSFHTLSSYAVAGVDINSTTGQESYCLNFGEGENRLHASPSDIIAYYDGKMVKTITFYSLIYAVSDYDKPHSGKDEFKVIEGITFRINAAFSTGKTVYFFTHNNYIVYADMKMDADYSKLTIDFDSAGEYYAEQFIYNNFLRPKGDTHTLDHPYIDGYYEYEKDADDTFPPTKVKTGGGKGENGTKPGSDPGDNFEDEPKKSSSTTWLIVIVLVIAALILAALGYLFFMRGSTERTDDPKLAAPKKAAVRKSLQVDPELMVKTVRSQVKSVVR